MEDGKAAKDFLFERKVGQWVVARLQLLVPGVATRSMPPFFLEGLERHNAACAERPEPRSDGFPGHRRARG